MKKYRDERAVKRAIDKVLKEHKIYTIMYVPVGFGKAGIPDYILNVRGRFVGLEAKKNAEENPPTPLQMKNLMEIRSGGGVAIVVDETNVGDFEQFLLDVMRTPDPAEVETLARMYSACELEINLE